MKAMIVSPSSINPKTQIPKMEDKESCYFPQCRKNANCECEMCLASISATLDLMPMSAQKSTLTKLSASKPTPESTPLSIDSTLLSTPDSRTPSYDHVSPSPAPVILSVSKRDNSSKIEVKKRKLRFRGKFWRWVLLVGVIFAVEFGFSWGVSRVLRPALSDEMMRDVVEECSSVEGLSEKLSLVQEHLEGILGDGVLRCDLGDSNWKIDRDGLILHSYCILYQSVSEEVIIRGWPLQTSGLLTAGFSSRSFSVLSGKLIEWPEGSMVHLVRDENLSWILRKWGASVVRFDANTWIIEYKKSMFLDEPSIWIAVIKFFNSRITKFLVKMKQHLWLLPDLGNYAACTVEVGSSLPT